MEPQDLSARGDKGKLDLRWNLPSTIEKPIAMSISIATNSEMTENVRTLVFPNVTTSLSVDSGKGIWFARVGSWIGTEQHGIIHWSAIVGPILVNTNKIQLPVLPTSLQILHYQSIIDGIRLHTGRNHRHYIVLEWSKEPKFTAGSTHWRYMQHSELGHVDCRNLVHPNKYSIRLSTFEGSETLPTSAIRQLCKGVAVHGKVPLKPFKYDNKASVTSDRASEIILKDVLESNKVKFHSHGDYLRYKIAMEKTMDPKRSV